MTNQQLAQHLSSLRGSDKAAADRSFESIASAAGGIIESLLQLSPPRQRQDHRQIALLAVHKAAITFNPNRCSRDPRRDASRFWSWVWRIVQSRLTNARKAETTRRPATVDPTEWQPADGRDLLAETLDDAEAAAILRRLSGLLSPQETRVFTMHVEGYSYAEIAAEAGTGRKAVDNALARARAKLKAHLSNGQQLFNPRDIARFTRR